MRDTYLHISIALLVLFFSGSAFSQSTRKSLEATRIEDPIRIDGLLDEAIWNTATLATGFTQYEPFVGKNASQRTEVKILYDNNSLYVGAVLYDSSPDSILIEYGERDEVPNTDWFGIYIDPYDDGLLSFGFFVTSAGVQVDVKVTPDDEDDNWDAVWDSKISMNNNGWVVEMEIPYSAIRFSKKEEQVWGINFLRQIRRHRELSAWNFIDPKIDNILVQHGILKGLRDITPPVRFALIPYVSGYIEKSPDHKKWGYSYKAGMDIKLGLSESFTLDMVLIPDFGQVESDDQVFNLSPFEIYYQEKRPFFMEGTELFNKGGVFYSRRIGDTPSGYDQLENNLGHNEKIVDNPDVSQLINATKITGKTKGGLAIGAFNAMTANTWGEVQDTISGQHRRIITEPFTNYNMLVFEQSLKNNSFVSLFNTNVFVPRSDYSANVTGTDFRINNKTNMFGAEGQFILSQKYNNGFDPELGYSYYFGAGKTGGNLTYDISYQVDNDTYDPNDMGFESRNNQTSTELDISYDLYDPWKIFIRWHNNLEIGYETLFKPMKFTELNIEVNSRATLRNYLTVGFNFYTNPYEMHDYYEPRVDGWMLVRPAIYSTRLFLSPDYRKRFVVDVSGSYFEAPQNNNHGYGVGITPRFRVNDRFFITNRFDYQRNNNEVGYVTDSISNGDEIIIMGQRNITEIVNTLSARYIFNTLSSLNFRLRYYWIKGIYNEFYDLTENGDLLNNLYETNHDFDYNAFTIDMVYTWHFMPGSQISVVWKNSIYTYNEENINNTYLEGFRNVLDSPATNSFSIKALFYIDYLYLKRRHENNK